jgi:hypothetical protein
VLSGVCCFFSISLLSTPSKESIIELFFRSRVWLDLGSRVGLLPLVFDDHGIKVVAFKTLLDAKSMLIFE